MAKRILLNGTVCLLLAVLSFAVFYSICAQPASDLSIHATWATEGSLLDPFGFVHHHVHPLWHFFVSCLYHIGLPLRLSAAVVTAAFKALQFLSVLWVARMIAGTSVREWQLTACCAAVVVAGPLCLPWYNPTVYIGPGTPNTWHSPTQVAALSFALVCVVFTIRSWERCRQLGARKAFTPVQWFVLTALLVCSALAKPVFLQAFIPAAALYFLILWIRHPQHTRYFWTLIAAYVPCVVVMVLQVVFYFFHPSDYTGMTFVVNWANIKDTFVCLLLMEAFPLFVVLTCRSKKRSMFSDLMLSANAFAFAEQMFLCETGRRASDGNFAWGLMAMAFLMWVLTLPAFLRQTQEEKERKGRAVAGWVLCAWHVGSGLYYIAYLLATGAMF